jgi:thioredoxin reductase (NADPH)
MKSARDCPVIVLGGGLAGLSAAVYLGRAKREAMVIDDARSMARWEPAVENYLGFPDGVSGPDLLERGRRHAARFGARFVRDRIERARHVRSGFSLEGGKGAYSCRRLLIATGAFHIPPDLPGVQECLGHSMFFCKDCDGLRVQGKPVGIYGWGNEAVEYALGLLPYSPCVVIFTDGRPPSWSRPQARWVREYDLPVHTAPIVDAERRGTQILAVNLKSGTRLQIEALFTTRGDLFHNELAAGLGAKMDADGQLEVDAELRTSVKGLYAAGCVTPANCQMIIAAGQGAAAAQAINRDLFEESLATHSLKPLRQTQLALRRTRPAQQRHPLSRPVRV